MFMTYGSNNYDLAMQVLGDTEVLWFKFISRTNNDVMQEISQYDDPTTINGSLQPVNRNLYEQYGFDQNKILYIFYINEELTDVQRNSAGDKLVFGNQVLQCESSVPDIFKMDGWVGMLCSVFKINADKGFKLKLEEYQEKISKQTKEKLHTAWNRQLQKK